MSLLEDLSKQCRHEANMSLETEPNLRSCVAPAGSAQLGVIFKNTKKEKVKSTRTYWNPLSISNSEEWEPIEGSDGNLSQLTIAEDFNSGDYTSLDSHVSFLS